VDERRAWRKMNAMDGQRNDEAMRRPLRLALLGCGSVGSQVVRLLEEHGDDLAARVGAPIELVGVAVRRLDAPREVDIPAEMLTTDAQGLVSRDDVDLVVEVIGGIEPARSLILTALENGASVVTANKALIAEDGSTLFAAAEKAGRDLYFEAAVAGAIPILRPLRESLAGDKVRRVLGIVNGTGNSVPSLRRANSSSIEPIDRTFGSAKYPIRCPGCRARKRSGTRISTFCPTIWSRL
jgi:homoserine dehydrogenase